jgi:hypothetical protein
MPDQARSRNAGLASRTGQKRAQISPAEKADPGAISVRGRNRSDLYGRDRAGQAEPKPAGNGANCLRARSIATQVAKRVTGAIHIGKMAAATRRIASLPRVGLPV